MIKLAHLILGCSSGLLAWILLGNVSPTVSQVIEDTTLPRPSQVRTRGNALVITGGTEAGRNLFHSFREFSVPNGRTASFQGIDPATTNIFSRVTGSRVSRIDGSIEVLRSDGAVSPANFFLLNPNGIIFGRNASLNVGGSFLATTAPRINFADGARFSAIVPESALLTVSIPVGLQFGRNPGNIVNRSTQIIRDTQGNPALFDGESYPGGLQVRPDRTLALVGGNIDLPSGYLFTASGRIELGSVTSPGQVSLSETDEGWRLGYAGIQRFGNIRLSQGATIDTSGSTAVDAAVGGGGTIQIQTGRISLTEGSQVLSVTEGTQSGQSLSIHASDSVTLSGIVNGINSGFSTVTFGSGNAGNLVVSTRSLVIRDGASLNSITNASGKSGSLNIRATDAVILDSTQPNFGTGLVTQTNSETASGTVGNIHITTGRLLIHNASLGSLTLGSGRGGDVSIQAQSVDILGNGLLYSQTQSAGATSRAGNITLQAQQLRTQEGGAISSTTFGAGRAGNITVKATDINMAGIALLPNGQPRLSPEGLTFPGGIFSGPDVGAIGNGGRIWVETQRLNLSEGAVLQTNTYGSGAAGDLIVHASDAIEVSGTANHLSPTGLLALSGGLPGQNFRAVRQATGAGGNLRIETGELTVRDGAVVAVSSINPEAEDGAGQLQIRAQNILLDRGLLDAQTESGAGANILIRQASVLLLRRNSAITTSAGTESGGGTGGNIDIQADFILANPYENSDITANAIQEDAGNIMLNERGLIGITPRERQTAESDITASSDFGNSGIISINTPRVDPTRGLVGLAIDTVDASQLIARGCAGGNGVARRGEAGDNSGGQFVVSGRGGLPPSPTDAGVSQAMLADWATLDLKPVASGQSVPPIAPSVMAPDVEETIAEAQGWVIDKNGAILLTAQPTGNFYHPEDAPSCAAQLSSTHHP